MRLIHVALTCFLLVNAPLWVRAAGTTTSVRAIAFVASNEKGATDSQLAPYEATLRSNLRFESFRYAGENSTSVVAGGTAVISLPNGSRIDVEGSKSGVVKVHFGGTTVNISQGRPAVLMGGTHKGGVSGVIVMAN